MVGLFLLLARSAEGKPITQPEPRLASLIATQNPITEIGIWSKPIQSPVRDFSCSVGESSGCVLYLRSRGLCVPKTPSGGAGSLPVRSTKLPPIGEEVYCVTYESKPYGHVGKCVNDGENLVYPINSTAQYNVPLNLFKGWH